MRGEHPRPAHEVVPREGIIPACAGSTGRCLAKLLPDAGSSPHARGALTALAKQVVLDQDHPRMRGEHERERRGAVRAVGIIPACAGSTRMP